MYICAHVVVSIVEFSHLSNLSRIFFFFCEFQWLLVVLLCVFLLQAFLEQLFPEVEVKAGDGVSGGLVPWLDAFEYQARQLLEGYKTEVSRWKL